MRQFVTEPLAAFFANYNHLKNERYVAIFDWGGGTLDITVLENRADGKIVELAKAGLQMAGDELNEAIAREIHRRLVDLHGFGKAFSGMPAIDREKLIEQCEIAKCRLSEKEEESIVLMDYGGAVVNEKLTRRQMGDVIRPHVRRALELLAKVIADSKLTKEEIGKVLVVGGSSRLLDVRNGIEQMFAGSTDKILKPKDAEWNVAKGAGRLDYRKGEYFSAEDNQEELYSCTIQCPSLPQGERPWGWVAARVVACRCRKVTCPRFHDCRKGQGITEDGHSIWAGGNQEGLLDFGETWRENKEYVAEARNTGTIDLIKVFGQGEHEAISQRPKNPVNPNVASGYPDDEEYE